MKFAPLDPPRVFRTGRGEPIDISDQGRIQLAPDEQVTFVTDRGAEYDVARKAWGYYATPSLNGRLLNFGLRAVLVRSFIGKYYVFLVERGEEPVFERYLEAEQNTIVRWLDNDADLAAIAPGEAAASRVNEVHCMCGIDRFTTAHMYFGPPDGEVRFAHAAGPYRRELFRCAVCGHYVSVHEMDGGDFYRGGYVDGTYGDADGMRRHFDRIMSLPPEQSDNAGRVRRVREAAATWLGDVAQPSVLDVGSGLCVFLSGMKSAGWRCTAVDPDPRAAAHARDTVGVAAITADFNSALELGRHHVVSFNKVLEHVTDPIAMLARAAAHLKPRGLVYVEVPDGEAAARDGFGREEFFIEHYHVFSAASLALLAARAGFDLLAIERLREPSTKLTLRAFLRRRI